MDFAFIIHSRDYRDIQRKFKITKNLPKKLIEFWCMHWPPIVVSKIISLDPYTSGKKITGWLVGVPMTAKQMIKNQNLAKKKITQAIKKAEKLGVGVIGLGALTSPLTNGGEDLVGKCGTNLTNGNTLTTCVSFEYVKNIIRENNKIEKIGIVGATGSIGQALLKLLIREYPEKDYLIFARTKKTLDKLIEDVKNKNPQINVWGYLNDLSELNKVDLMIVVTSAAEALIKQEHLKQNAIIYDITQPKNLDQKILETRPDVKAIDGGLIYIDGLKERLPFGLPPKTVFACFAETALLAATECKINTKNRKTENGKIYLVGKTNLELTEKIWNLFKKSNFQLK